MDHSWIESANQPSCDFPLHNLPYCVIRDNQNQPAIGIAIGDQILNLAELAQSIQLPCAEAIQKPKLNDLMAEGEQKNRVLRAELIRLLEDRPSRLRDNAELVSQVLHPIETTQFLLPIEVGDYTDFYASKYHATNVGSMFRPDQPLLPNYQHVPIGYHGRSSSIVVSGTEIRRPVGQTSPQPPNELPTFGPSRKLDYELELGIIIGSGNKLGSTIAIDDAPASIFGFCLLNDWSARDVQKWEYQPLGPFLAKSFATSLSPFVVTAAALEPFRCAATERSENEAKPLPYLVNEADQAAGGIDLFMEVHLTTAKMREADMEPFKISRGNFSEMYWTVNQLVTHHASNGCNLRPGDLLGSGTVSGEDKTSRGCLLERNWDGAYGDPVSGSQRTPLQLPTGEKRDFLEDGDEIILSAFCEKNGSGRIGLGKCVGRIIPAHWSN